MSMNRQSRRLARRAGGEGDEPTLDDDALLAAEALGADGTAGGATVLERRVRLDAAPSSTRGLRRVRPYLHEVNVEMRKVAWPTRAETVNYASVVLVTLAVLMALIFGLDLGFANVANYLFK